MCARVTVVVLCLLPCHLIVKILFPSALTVATQALATHFDFTFLVFLALGHSFLQPWCFWLRFHFIF